MVGDGSAGGYDPRPSTPSTWPSATSGWSLVAPTSATCPATSTSPGSATTRSRPSPTRAPVADDVDVVIVGGGIAGVLAGAQLRKAGIERIRIIDQAGGIGGTWYWNRYPGVMCDVESYIYLPMLEELGYVPTHRYAFGEEIRLHLQAIAERFDLVADALFHTGVTRSEWDEDAARWRVSTDRGDELTCRYYVLAVGILNLLKLPAIPGMEDFGGTVVPHRALGLRATPAVARASRSPSSATRSSASSAPAPPASSACRRWRRRPSTSTCSSARRRPSACGATDPPSRSSPPGCSPAGSRPGWTTSRPSCSAGPSTRTSSTTAGRTTSPPSTTRLGRKGMTVEEYLRSAEEVDYGIMEEHRRRVEELVDRPRHRRDPQAVLPVPVQAPLLPRRVPRRVQQPQRHPRRLPGGHRPGHRAGPGGRRPPVRGRLPRLRHRASRPSSRRCSGAPATTSSAGAASRLAEKWADGAASLFGMMSRGFPNLFVMPAPGQQAVVTVNYTQLAVLGAEFVGGAVGILEERGVQVFDVERRGRGALDPEDRRLLRRRQPGHVRLHAVADQPGGPPGVVEPAQRQLRPGLR